MVLVENRRRDWESLQLVRVNIEGILAWSPRHRAAEVCRIGANPGASDRAALQGEEGRAVKPGLRSGLGPWSALGLLLSSALSSAQAGSNYRSALARRQSPVDTFLLVSIINLWRNFRGAVVVI